MLIKSSIVKQVETIQQCKSRGQVFASSHLQQCSAKPGSDRLVDAVVAYGTVDEIAARLKEHRAAGADHVPVQVLTGPDKLVDALAELAGPLGLN